MTDHVPSAPTSANAGRTGILSAVLASTCCVVPLVLAAAGLGGLGLGTFFGEYHWYFLGSGIAGLALGWGLYLRERRACRLGPCQITGGRRTFLTLSAATLVVVAFGSLNAYVQAADPVTAVPEASTAGLTRVVLPVEGMTCFTCELAVENSLKDVAGVAEADASVSSKSVSVSFDAGKAAIQDLVEAVNRAGYRARLPDAGAS